MQNGNPFLQTGFSCRPPMEDNDWPFQTPQIMPDHAMYKYGAYIINLFGDSKIKRWERVWVKWPRFTEW